MPKTGLPNKITGDSFSASDYTTLKTAIDAAYDELFPKTGGDISGQVNIGELTTVAKATRLLNVIGSNAVSRVWRIHSTNHPSYELILSKPEAPDTIVAYYDMALDDTGAIVFRDRTTGGSGKIALRLTDTEVVVPGNLSVNGFYNGVNLTQLKTDFDQLKIDFEALKAQVNNTTPPATEDLTNIKYIETFEGKTKETAFEGLTHQYTVNEHAFDVIPNPYGTGTVGKFELRQGDASQSNGTRTEVLYPIQGHNERWYAFSVYLPSTEVINGVVTNTWANDNKQDIITQWHQGSSNPPLSVRFINSTMRIDTRSTATGTTQLDVMTGGYTKDAWVRFVFHIVFSPTNTGVLEVWKDGVKVVNRVGIPNCFEGDLNLPRWKVGIYKSDWNNGGTTNVTLRRAYFDNVKMGDENATYEQMA